MSLFDYRLVETQYSNRIVHEDNDPGGLSDIVAYKYKRVMHEWKSEDEGFGKNLLASPASYLSSYSLNKNSDDGWIEYSYTLERRSHDASEWKYVGHLTRSKVKKDEQKQFGDEDDYYDQYDE